MTTSDSSAAPLRVGLISLGCAKNLVDAEIMLGTLMNAGVEVTPDATQADVVIVNTCSFIDAAQEESVDTILESAALREAHRRGQGLVVSGCLPQRFRDQLPQLMPEVDAFMGIDQVTQVTRIVREALEHRQRRVGVSDRAAGKGRDAAGVKRRLAQLDAQSAPSGEAGTDLLPGAARRGRSRVTLGSAATAGAVGAGPAALEVNARPKFIPDFATPRFRLTPRHFAYLKIAEGCNHPCSFCIIPRMRGSHRSRPQSDLVEEARRLLDEGVREINLISQDSTYYGLDLHGPRAGSLAAPGRFAAAARSLPAHANTLSTLLRALDGLPGDFWIRLLYTHPAHWTDELIRTMADCGKVARYVDMPLQHIHDLMLERMRRETDRRYIETLIERLRAGIPGIALRTTFIVGFPGETDACFESLLTFIRETRFERLGVFAYSREEGTRAGAMSGQVPAPVRQARRRVAMREQRRVARELAASMVGRTLRVLIERPVRGRELRRTGFHSWEHGETRVGSGRAPAGSGSVLVARGEADAPDIDGRVYVRGTAPCGAFAPVRVVGHTDYDLLAEPAA